MYEALTVEQNIRFFGALYGLSDERIAARMKFVLEMAGLSGRESTKAKDLAGGWRQRLALGCAILHEPRIVFLDEPTGGVDPMSRRQFWRLIEDMSRSGVTILVTTHYLDEAEHCHRHRDHQRRQACGDGHVARTEGRSSPRARSSRSIRAVRSMSCARSKTCPDVEKTTVFGTAVHAVLRDARRRSRRP